MEKSNFQLTLGNIYRFFEKSENLVLSSFFLFIIFLVAQHSMVFLYHDDWGVSVLNYVGKQTGFNGQEFSFSQVIDFLWGMYNRWTGRVVSIFTHIYLQKSGVWVVRIWQVLAISITVYLSYRIAIKALSINKRGSYLLLLSIVLYLSMPARSLITGIYWFSAASGYLWGVPFFLLGVYLCAKANKVTFFPYILMAFAATFHELMGVAVIAYLFSYIFLDTKEFIIKKTVYSLLPIATTLVTVLAPGNFARKAVSHYGDQSTFNLIINNFNAIADRVFTPSTLFFAFICFSFLSMFWKLIPEKLNSKYKIIALVTTFLFLIFIFTTLTPIFSGSIFIISYTVLMFLSCKETASKQLILPLYISSIATLLPLLLSPGVAWRAQVPFFLLMFVPILFSIGLLESRNEIRLRNLFFSIAVLFSCYNSYSIFMGYKQNYGTNQANDFILRAVSERVERGNDFDNKVILFKLPAPYYAETMPYERPLIETWMKQYYSLPQSMVFEWK